MQNKKSDFITYSGQRSAGAIPVPAAADITEEIWYKRIIEKYNPYRKRPEAFEEIIRRWILAKKLTFAGEEAFERFVRAVAWKIERDGTELFPPQKKNLIS
ncbi:MAG: hypothetical protein LUG18_05585 [Candidatus Azobacteroides sp.]|nr:hypothetical protein [Candidatus Azobacteroides sp.]